MERSPKNYDSLIGQIPGLSEKLFKAHFVLYQGYVKKLNDIEQKLKAADPKTANYSFGEISELLRRRAVASNGADLHEIFFESLCSHRTPVSGDLAKAIDQNFGSYQRWMDEVRAGLISSPGWVLLVRSLHDGTLKNILITEHHIGLLADHQILLALDGWEHAYFIDYGAQKADYITALEACIDWKAVAKRFAK